MTSSPDTPDRDAEYERARERAEELQGLYIHLLVYVVVNAALFGINWVSAGGDGPWWFYWPLLGWGVGLLIHILTVVFPVFSNQWVDRRTERILANRHR
jgi:hypothetical protein